MNPADLCPEGRELLAEWKAWHERAFACYLVQWDSQRRDAWRRYREHVESCEFCKEE
jgi:hypothetical protein